MLNIFVTYACNLRCPYCFARDMLPLHPAPISRENFYRLLTWATEAGVGSLAFIGGEPTLHPDLAEMIENTAQAGIAPVLFTNALGSEQLMTSIAPHVQNFVVNYNEPSLFSPQQLELFHSNLAFLASFGKRLTFSKNFSPWHHDYEYLLEGLARYGAANVRYDISRPGLSGGNEYVDEQGLAALMPEIIEFVKKCRELGVKTGLDCCLPLCEANDQQLALLRRESTKFTGICHPSIDIHPDLSASYCLPMYDLRVPDITAFLNEEEARWHFAEAARPCREQNVDEKCRICASFLRVCQGGCLALRPERVQ